MPGGGDQSVLARLINDPAHGRLPVLLIGLTIVTGVVDAVSILALGRVFVANMTGNVVFVGFALAGAPGFSLAASFAALAGFVIGALVGGRLRSSTTAVTAERLRLLRAALVIEVVVIAIALGIAAATGQLAGHPRGDAAAGIVAVGLGVQNSVVRRLKVPDITTTVLTLTLTGVFADIKTQSRHEVARRFFSIAAMLIGAISGAVIVLHDGPAPALGMALGLALIAFVATLWPVAAA